MIQKRLQGRQILEWLGGSTSYDFCSELGLYGKLTIRNLIKPRC